MTEQPEPVLEPFGLISPPKPPEIPAAPEPDAVWDLPGGKAWVYLANSRFGIQKPVILSDGFETGPSKLDPLWHGLDRTGYPFATKLRERGHDLIVLGYDERSASILENAETATACIRRTIAERKGDAPLTVGGFSMGGLVTRYALAKMETEGVDHQTGTYLSFDSPHRGAWIPISLQALAHFLKATPAMSKQINSDAARQLLWRHIETADGTPRQDPLRTRFLEELDRVGWWPRIPRLLGVANGSGSGTGNGVKAGVDAIRVTSGWFTGTTLRTQAGGTGHEVARLKGLLSERRVVTDDLPELDGAPGGTLESFGIAGSKLRLTGKVDIEPGTESICFVPSVSAVAVRDLENQADLYLDIEELSKDESELDDFMLSPRNDPHSFMSEELAIWILKRLPD
ncbi:esterase/lipase family protein [Kitasatospora aureofaciens]|uniref:esterase/lipase family protein n=1 Tax=Kitasatospora aureofaciens TaxID=1894 RepID=UPI0038304E07